MIKLILLFISLVLLIINIGCSPIGVLATGGGATLVVAEGDKSLGTVVDDATIKLNLSAKFLQSENKLFGFKKLVPCRTIEFLHYYYLQGIEKKLCGSVSSLSFAFGSSKSKLLIKSAINLLYLF